MYRIIKTTVYMVITGVLFYACTKTEYNYLKRPYNDVKLFTVAGSYGDSIKGLISEDSITIYWNPDVQLPSTVTPSIVVADGAKINPASGESIPFNEHTVYTVTAEDGTTKNYRLKIVLMMPIPVLSPMNGVVSWMSTSQLYISGEYFLAGTDPSEISAYMQRASDGFEIPLELPQESITNYRIVANLPPFTAEQDTGVHKLFVKAGSRLAESIDVRFIIPPISNTTYTCSLLEDGQPVHSGDSLTVNFSISDNYDGKIANYYKNGITSVLLYTANYDIITVPKENLKVTDGKVRFKVPDISQYVGKSLFQYRFTFKSVPVGSEASSAYSLRGFMTADKPIAAK